MLLLTDCGILVKHIVKVGDIGQPDTVAFHGCEDPVGASGIHRSAEVQGVRDWVEHRLGRNIGFRRVQRGGELNVVGVEVACELQPVFDCPVGVRIAHLPWREFLQRGRKHADPHEAGLELPDAVYTRRLLSLFRCLSCHVRCLLNQVIWCVPGAQSPAVRRAPQAVAITSGGEQGW
jgi:hypothetical protein